MRLFLALVSILAGATKVCAQDGYDTIVVCPKPLTEALRPWLAYRMEQGRKMGIITDCDSPQRIRAGIRAAARSGKLTHVLIVGDDHPQRETSARLRKITVPAAEIEAQVNVHWGSEAKIATDNWYADLDDDDVPDVAIGRLTADSPEELAVMIRKIIDYETSAEFGPWRRRVNFIAGVGGFGAVTDTILDMATKKFITHEIPAGYQTSMTYASLNSPYCPDPRRLPEVAVARHNEGCLFWVYVGHGQRQWLDYMLVKDRAYPILNLAHVRDMHADSGAPIAVFLACYAGAFDEREDCLSEVMLARPHGPVAVIAGTRVTMPYANAVLAHALLQQCFTHDHDTLGELLLYAKREAAAGKADDASRQLMDALAAAISPQKGALPRERTEHLHMYNLIGDPLLRLRRPQNVELSVKDTAVGGEVLQVKGDSPVGGRCTIELVCRRDLLTFDSSQRAKELGLGHGFKLNDETAKQLTDGYARANDQRWKSHQIDIARGKFQSNIELPPDCLGHCHVRIYVEGEKDFALGAADVYVQRPAASRDDSAE